MLLYDVVVRPIEIIIEIVFTLLYRFFGNPGAAIIAVSVVVSFLVLPLYLRADKIQEEEQQKARKMERWVTHIRKTFSGDEKYMLQSAYYKEQGYKPLYALRGTLSILLQIPFFMAAYHYLSNVQVLEGSAFCMISDLSRPDGLIRMGNMSFHILPIMMTLINCVSGAIYTKGFPLRQKLQVYILAVFFLILLYQSPSGLVIYWTMNNLFSLLKNIVIKYVRDKRFFLIFIMAIIGIFYFGYCISAGKLAGSLSVRDYEAFAGYFLISIFLWIPLGILLLIRKSDKAKQTGSGRKFSVGWFSHTKSDHDHAEAKQNSNRSMTVLTSVVIVLFGGVFIPLSVVSSSPLEFVNIYHYQSPLWFVIVVMLIYAGFFLLWGCLVICQMMSEKAQHLYSQGLFVLLLLMILNYNFFSADMGSCGMELNFLYEPHFLKGERYGSLLIIAVLIAAGILLHRYMRRLCQYILYVLAAAVLVQSIMMTVSIKQELKGVTGITEVQEDAPAFPLSRTGKNVVVIMLDRAIGGYVPFIMEEKPELIEKYDGFTFYPNTLSSGMWTGVGSPAIFGGYEYLAENMNRRRTETNAEKHNQALKLMPYLFSENGYHVTVSDLPYVGYQEIPDYSIFDEMDVSHFFYEDRFSSLGEWNDLLRKVERNLLMYSVMRTAPAFLQDNIYDHSCYLTGDGATTEQSIEYGQAYRALENISDYTVFTEEDKGELILYANYLTHEPAYMQLPDYTYAEHVNNEDYHFDTVRELNGVVLNLENGDYYPVEHYFVDAAALLRLGEWFDLLREEGVYDNTRIILVADHGRPLGQFSNMKMSNGMDVEGVNTLLMVKDFDSRGFCIDDQFMTNADAPQLAMEGIIKDPVNPYTGESIQSDYKKNGICVFLGTEMGMLPGNEVLPAGTEVWHVKDNIFREENWSHTEAP